MTTSQLNLANILLAKVSIYEQQVASRVNEVLLKHFEKVSNESNHVELLVVASLDPSIPSVTKLLSLIQLMMIIHIHCILLEEI